jgi:hypothetical protein
MKKIVNILFATAVTALAMVSCQKKELAVDVNENEVVESPIHFYATEIATKTVFGDFATDQYPTLWTNSKNIKISYNKKSSVEATVTPQSGGTKAVFTPASSFSADGSSHIFYAMSPATAQGANISSSYYSWRFIIPASQTPLTNSVDEDAQIIYAKYDAGDTFPTSVPFAFSHVTAYGKLSFSNLALDGDEDITSITLTASKDWVGHYFYYVATKDPNTEGDFTARDGYVSKKITLTTDKSSDIWFACAPVDLSGGGTIDINIFTNKGVFVKKVTFPAAKGNFQAGHVASFTVNMSGIARTAMVNNIAAIKTLYSSADVPFVANLTNALVTIVSGDNFYMEDATGGVLVYTSGHGMAKGDKLNGVISGTITDFNKTKEITGFDCSATKTPGNVVTPTTIAHGDLVDAFASYESKFVRVEGLTVAAVSGKDITISENANLKIRNESGVTITEGTQLNVEGAAVYYNSNKQVKIYSQADADLLAIGSVITASDKSVDVGDDVAIGATTNSPATITYLSANTSIATVDESGTIHGVAAGSTTITCSVAASGKYLAGSKVINVTVSAGSSNTWTRVTTVDQITSGGTFIIGYEAEANSGVLVPMRNDGRTASTSADGLIYSGTTNESGNSGTITMAASMSGSATSAYEIVIEAGAASGTIAIKLGTNYVGCGTNSSGKTNTCRLYTSKGDATDFTPTVTSGKVKLQCMSTTLTDKGANYNPSFQYNSGSPRFATYWKSGQQNLVLYKKS